MVPSYPPLATTDDFPGQIAPNVVIAGRYTLIEKIGEGGMGEVWVARQTEPVKRKVALKLIKTGMDSRAVVQRFEQERQALALMDHPHIAKVLDGGASHDFRPFFVMEFVNGLPLTRFCDEGRLGIRERLELFVPVCQAVQHAHQKGIVHRDLKPSNILVTLVDGRPIPKVIDFGVAKATGGKLTEQTMSTQLGAVVGTLEYMAPEQAGFSGADVDTRADIYSLGVILYELLTGLKPFDRRRLKEAAFDQLIRIIREEEPSKPSTRISTDASLPALAAVRQIGPARLKKLLRGELDWVVMKCLEKQRDRRYETASALSRDIQRYLADETVEARPPSPGYRLQKLFRRNKGPVIAASLVFLALLGGVIGTTLGLFEAKRQEGLALEAKQKEFKRATSEAAARRDEQTQREEAERQAKIAEERTAKLKTALAASYFAQGLYDYDAGRPDSALANLTRAWAMTEPENPLCSSYRRVLIDRCLQGGKLIAQFKGTGHVKALAFSPDGSHVATGSVDFTARLWNAQSGQPVGNVMQHQGWVNSVAFSGDGTRLVTASHDGTARLWDAQTGAPLGNTMRHQGFVDSARFSWDGTRVITRSQDRTARLWDGRTGDRIGAPLKHDQLLTVAIFSPDGTSVLTAGFDRMAQLWDASTGTPIAALKDPGTVRCAAFLPGGNRVVTGSNEGVRLWDASTGARLQIDIPHLADCIAVSPDGTRILTGGSDSTARIWDARTGALVGEPMRHGLWVHSVAFSPDGARVITGSSDGTARIWNAYTGAPAGEPMKHQREVLEVAFDSDGSRVATMSGNVVKIWDADSGPTVGDLIRGPGAIVDRAISSDGTRMAIAIAEGDGTGTVRLWDVVRGKSMGQVLRVDGRIGVVVFSPDGKQIATAAGEVGTHSIADASIRLWDAHTGAPSAVKMQPEGTVVCLAFNPDGTRLVSAGFNDQYTGQARLWDVRTGAPVGAVMRHAGVPSRINSVAFTSDGSCVVTVSVDGTGRLWDAQTGGQVGETMRHRAPVACVAVSPDGKRITTGSFDGTARLWQAASGTPVGTPMRHEGLLESVAFSSDGARVVTAASDKTARVWDAFSGEPIGEAMLHPAIVKSAAFSSDGTIVATQSLDSTFRLWDAGTAVSVGIPLRGTAYAALLPHSGRIVSFDASAQFSRLSEVTVPDFENVSPATMRAALGFWTGFSADEDGAVRELNVTERNDLQQQLGANDPICRYLDEGWLRRGEGFHRRAAAAAELTLQWFAAAFHVRALLKKEPANSDLQKRLAVYAAQLPGLNFEETVPRPVAVELLRTKVPRSFQFDLDPQVPDPDPGIRIWTRVNDTVFVERYPNGKEGKLKIVERASVAGVEGTLVQKVDFERVQVFIPDRDSHNMEIKYRLVDKPDAWTVLGVINNVE